MDGASAVQGGLLEDGSHSGTSALPAALPKPLGPQVPPDQWDEAQRKSPGTLCAAFALSLNRMGIGLHHLGGALWCLR